MIMLRETTKHYGRIALDKVQPAEVGDNQFGGVWCPSFRKRVPKGGDTSKTITIFTNLQKLVLTKFVRYTFLFQFSVWLMCVFLFVTLYNFPFFLYGFVNVKICFILLDRIKSKRI